MQKILFLFPELILTSLILVLLLIDIGRFKFAERLGFHVSWFVYGICALFAFLTLQRLPYVSDNALIHFDVFTQSLKILFCGLTMLTFVLARPFTETFGFRKLEGYILITLATLGAMVTVGSRHFLTLYLGLELLAFATCVMIAIRRGHALSIESAMKYFVLTALASGMLLYGFSMFYGAAGDLNFSQVASVLAQPTALSTLFLFGLIFVVAGVAFKLGAAPFHMWMPDIYQGAPVNAVTFLGTVPKIVMVAVFYQLFKISMPLAGYFWVKVFLFLGLASLIIGTTAALVQNNFRRMLGYSAISQLGFLSLAMMADVVWSSINGRPTFWISIFYVVVYALNSLLSFAVLFFISSHGEIEDISDLSGLNKRSPLLAFLLMLSMLSLAGIPPAIGFYAKFYMIAGLVGSGHFWLASFTILMSVVAAFYYLRVIKVMYFDEPKHGILVITDKVPYVIYLLLGLAILILGFFPDELARVIQSSF